MNSIERFDILNNCLGYGNAISKIIHFSLLEESGNWSINELIKDNTKFSFHNKEIEKIYIDKKLEFIEKITKINSLLSCNIIKTLDDDVRKREDLQNHVYECEANTNPRISQTEKFQFEVSKYATQYMNNNVKFNDDFRIFGIKNGNEICLNYNPVGKNSTGKVYYEYEIFFGLNSGKPFPDKEREYFRRKIIQKFIKEKINLESYIFIYGSKGIGEIKDLLGVDLNFRSFEIIGREISWFSVDFEKKIWYMYHPSKKNKKRPLIGEIPYIFNPIELSKVREIIKS